LEEENEQPLISIIIPVFNRVASISQALNSVSTQTYSNWECIVVDDGSTDGTQNVINSFIQENTRIRIIQRNRNPKGASTCRNIGIENSKGKYIIFLDSDDYLLCHCLASRLSVFKQYPNCDFIVFQMLVDNRVQNKKLLWNIDSEENDLLRFLHFDFVWSITSPIWNKNSLLKLGGFDENLNCWQDIDLSLRAIVEGCSYSKKLNLSPDCVNVVHKGESISQNGAIQEKYLKSKEIVISKLIKFLPKGAYRSFLWVPTVHIGMSYYKLLKREKAYKFLTEKLDQRVISTTEYAHLRWIGLLLKLRIYYRLKKILTKVNIFPEFFREEKFYASTFRKITYEKQIN